MAKPRFARLEVVFDNPPDKHGFATFTIVRTVGRSDHRYERHVNLDDLLSSPEAARILRISVRHLYRLVKEGRIKYKKQKAHLWFVSKEVQRVQLARKRGSRSGESFLIN
jgi:hypothetical protein